jgi:hypothetical protein
VNRLQRITTLVGFCVVGLMLLVPPWKYIQTMRSGDRIPPLERNAGYALVFSPPSLKDHEAIREAFAIPKTREVVHTFHTNDLWSSIPDASPTPSPTPDIIPVEIYESYFEVRLDTTRLLAQCGAVALVTLGLVVFLHRGTVLAEARALNIEEGTSRLVAWMPGIGRREPVRQLVGAMLIPIGQELPDPAMYLSFLADRVEAMLKREDDPKAALQELVRQLVSEGLLVNPPRTQHLEEAAQELIADPALSMRLAELDVPGNPLPKKIYGGNPEAKRLVETTSLWTWANYVMNRPSDDLR